MALIIHKFVVGPLATNCYLVSCEYTGFTNIIDPGDNPAAIINYLRRNEFIPQRIILTHGHPDHGGAVRDLRNQLGLKVMIHPADKFMLAPVGIPEADRHLTPGEFLPLGRSKFLVIHTPGHSPGSICLQTERILFSGDTLFKDGVGRTDLPGGSWAQLQESLTNKLFILSPETKVYPGHGPETTIGYESSGR